MEKDNSAYEIIENGVTPVTQGSSQPPPSNLSLKEKYFQVEPEGRIRRVQYLVRSIVPSILFFFIIFGGTIMLIPIMIFLGGTLASLLGPFVLGEIASLLGLLVIGGVYWIFYKLAKVNSVKRAHDFGSDGKIAVYIVTASFVMGIVGLVVGVLQVFGLLPTADVASALRGLDSGNTEDPRAAMKLMSEAVKNATPLYERLLGYISNAVSIASVVTWFVLLFRPGVAGDNQYGKDASKNKVSFLG